MAGSGDPPLNGLMGTCALMFLGAYGCGMLPSWVPVSEQRMASVSFQEADTACRVEGAVT